MKSEREETRHRYGKKADFYSPGGQIRSGDYEKRGRNGNVETCPYETRHRNNPGMARGWPSHDAKEERNASLSLSLFPFASPLLFLAPATIERKAGCSCTCCRTRLRSKFDRHPAGPGEKETIRNNKVEGTLVETLNVPRSSVPSKIRCIRECPVSAVRPSTRQVQGHPRLTKTTPPPPLPSILSTRECNPRISTRSQHASRIRIRPINTHFYHSVGWARRKKTPRLVYPIHYD